MAKQAVQKPSKPASKPTAKKALKPAAKPAPKKLPKPAPEKAPGPAAGKQTEQRATHQGGQRPNRGGKTTQQGDPRTAPLPTSEADFRNCLRVGQPGPRTGSQAGPSNIPQTGSPAGQRTPQRASPSSSELSSPPDILPGLRWRSFDFTADHPSSDSSDTPLAHGQAARRANRAAQPANPPSSP